MNKIYCFIQGRTDAGHYVVAVSEEGIPLASQVSPNLDEAKAAIGLNDEGAAKRARYQQHYPAGYELVWSDSPKTEPWYSALGLGESYNPLEVSMVWADFAMGKWVRSSELTQPGTYPTTTNEHYEGSQFKPEVLYLRDGQLWQAVNWADEDDPIPFKGWWWSKPFPNLPPAPPAMAEEETDDVDPFAP